MRTTILGTIALLITLVSGPVKAECYGDGIQALGCQNAMAPTSRGGELVRFGAEAGPVIPNYYGQNTGFSSDDLVSIEERRSMMRDIILRGGRTAPSGGALNQAVNAQQRPIRPFSSRRLRGYSQ
jgi:hypothetical protein